MSYLRTVFLGLITISFLTLLGCGGSTNNGSGTGGASFTILPGGPVIVVKGANQQFTTDPVGITVTWSVQGGNANGSIDANGLYTTPGTLPLNSVVTVQAEDSSGTATATVQLYTNQQLSFGGKQQVNNSPINDVIYLSEGGDPQNSATQVADRVGARSGSLHVDAIWNQDSDDSGPNEVNPFYSFSDDLGPFSPELNLASDVSKIQLDNCLITDLDQNPGLFFTDVSGSGGLLFRGSSDQGKTINAPVQVVVPASGNREKEASAQVDANNRYHVVFTEAIGGRRLRFYQSSDQGKTWQQGGSLLPPPISMGQVFPNLSVSPDGQEIFICYNEGGAIDEDIFFIKSSDGGQSFGAAVNVSQTGKDNGACRVARGPSGEVYLSYLQKDSGTGNVNVLLKKSVDGGLTFTSPVRINSVPQNPNKVESFLPFLSVDQLGRVDLVWSDDDNKATNLPRRLLYARSTDGGQTFSSPLVIASENATTLVFGMGLVHDQLGRLHVLYGFQTVEGNPFYDIFHEIAE